MSFGLQKANTPNVIRALAAEVAGERDPEPPALLQRASDEDPAGVVDLDREQEALPEKTVLSSPAAEAANEAPVAMAPAAAGRPDVLHLRPTQNRSTSFDGHPG
jgi:hypothetical protein